MSRKKTNKIEAETGEVVQSNRPFIIRNGGIAKPLGHGLYLLGGKTHEQGGIDIDFTGDARIFSAQPILNGKSPAELVAKGANPNITFNRQERFKDVNSINDDGSKKAKYGVEEVLDNTKVQMPRTDVEPIKRSNEELRMEGWRTVDYGNGEVGLVPPLATGSLIPVYPEYDLMAGIKGLATALHKQVMHSILPKRKLNSAFHKLSTVDNFKLGNIKQNNKYNGVIKAAEDTKSFFEEDVIPRINKVNEKVGILGNKRYSAINDDLEDIGVEVLNARSGKISGYSTSGDVTVPIKGRHPNETMVHEVHHAYRNRYGENRLKQPTFVDGNEYTIGKLNDRIGYSDKEIKILDDAYDFTEDYLTKNNINPLYEKGASNTEMRYRLSRKNNNAVGQELDNIINSLSESDIIELLKDTNEYTENFAKYIKKLSNRDRKDKINSIKWALQRVGGYATPIYLTNEFINNKEMQTKDNNNKKRLGGSTGLIRVQANGKDRLMYVPFTGEETKANRKKAKLGISWDVNGKTLTSALAEPQTNDSKLPDKITLSSDVKSKINKSVEDTYNRNNKLSWWKNDWVSPAISTLGNIGAGLTSYFINKNMLKDLDYAPAPVAKRAVKLKTNININPELTTLGESLSKTIDATNANTASSRVANARNQASMLNTILSANKLYADKENRETVLINQDKLNQQEVANANIDAYNTWRTGKTTFENTIREQQSENAVSLVDNINKGIQTGITDAERRRQFRNNLAIMAAAYPNVTPALLRSYGADFLRMGGKVKLNKKK